MILHPSSQTLENICVCIIGLIYLGVMFALYQIIVNGKISTDDNDYPD